MITIASCSSDDDISGSTYTVKFDLRHDESTQMNMTCYEYNELGEPVGNNTINNIQEGTSQTFTANNDVEKVKVYFNIYYWNINYNGDWAYKNVWVKQVFYLKKNKDTVISITDETKFTSKEP